MFFGSRLNRLATSIRRGISKYSVGSDNPGLVFDFIDNFYQKDKNQTVNFDGAITHARAGNATMTDGYGPELVTNGSFTDSIDGWSGAGWVWSSRGASYDSGSSVTVALSQDVAVEAGKTYIVTFTLIDVSGGTPSLMDGEQSLQSHSASGNYEYVYIADSSTFELGFKGGTAAFYVDNVSVREMPVIKWAPHNLFSYSEQLDNSYWQKTLVTVSANSTVAPNGTTTADKLIPTVVNNSHYIGNVISYPVAGETYELCVFAKPAGYNFIKLFGANSGTSEAWFDISNGTKGTTGGTGFVSSSITDVGNGWYRCALKFINPDATARNTGYYVVNADNVQSFAGDGTSGIHVWGAHLYKADLGGMVDNPDRGDSYVPTTSSAKYLPRIGHHVYNGSAWVNEGLLAESESRTNLETYSALPDAQWTNTQSATVEDQAVSPSGLEDAIFLRESSANGTHRTRGNPTPTVGTTYTFSVFAKKKERTIFSIGGAGLYGSNELPEFDVDNGIAYNGGTGNADVNIQDVGNGWFRCSVTFTATGTSAFIIQLHDSLVNSTPPSVSGKTYTGDGTSGMYFWGAQLEATSSPPSSFIPTSGSGVTRAAESFTIPSANLPWPEPNYIGSELVTNGTFDTDVSGWSVTSNGTFTYSSNAGVLEQATGSNASTFQSFTTVAGKVYRASVDVSGTVCRLMIGTSSSSNDITSSSFVTGTITSYFVASGTTTYISIQSGATVSGLQSTIDNVSVREINPLSVSIAMDGRITYADTGNTETTFFDWRNTGGSTSYIQINLRTQSTATGEVYPIQRGGGVADDADGRYSQYNPGVLVPFNIASRHGSTFINASIDGVAITADTSPTVMPDLEPSNLDLAHDKYMGTIGTFRVWDKDLGDTGTVEATNPSLEPSLSLTFEGTGTSSFTVSEWSE